jgi:hypothetical protein
MQHFRSLKQIDFKQTSGIIRFFRKTRTYLKNKISVQGKAQNGEKAEHTRSM